MSTKDLLRQRLKELLQAKADLEARAAPLRAKLDAAAREYEQARLKWEAVKDQLLPQIRAIEQPEDATKPHIVRLSQEISAVATALGGYRMSGG